MICGDARGRNGGRCKHRGERRLGQECAKGVASRLPRSAGLCHNQAVAAMPEQLFVTHLEVFDDLAEQTFTIALEDLVKLVDDPRQPGAHRETTIRLLNAATKDRLPRWMTPDGRRVVHVTVEEYSDIKLSVFTCLLKWVKAERAGSGGKVM